MRTEWFRMLGELMVGKPISKETFIGFHCTLAQSYPPLHVEENLGGGRWSQSLWKGKGI